MKIADTAKSIGPVIGDKLVSMFAKNMFGGMTDSDYTAVGLYLGPELALEYGGAKLLSSFGFKFLRYPKFIKTNIKDDAADILARKLHGYSSVEFPDSKWAGREFDFYTRKYLGQTKPANFKIGSSFRKQAKATFEAAKEFKRTPYFHFDGEPDMKVIRQIQEYSRRYGVDFVIDTTKL